MSLVYVIESTILALLMMLIALGAFVAHEVLPDVVHFGGDFYRISNEVKIVIGAATIWFAEFAVLALLLFRQED